MKQIRLPLSLSIRSRLTLFVVAAVASTLLSGFAQEKSPDSLLAGTTGINGSSPSILSDKGFAVDIRHPELTGLEPVELPGM